MSEENVLVEGNEGDVPAEEVTSDLRDVDFYNPNNGTFGRSGGPYLDEVEMASAEVQRAAREGRKPVTLEEHLNDRSKKLLSASAGVQLVTKEVLSTLPVVVVDVTSEHVGPQATLPVDVTANPNQ